MRPVNLIPPDERRGEQAPLRRGSLAYLVVGGFVAILVAVTSLVLVGNQIAVGKSEVTTLKREDQVAQAKVERLASYIQFRTVSEQRVQTVSSLADSRFDWERVMRELTLVLPSDVWLVNLTATAAPGAAVEGASGGGGGGTLRAGAAGPALELNGCAAGQRGVAGFVTSLKDIDGVTRVGVASSELPEKEAAAGASGSEGGNATDEDCRTREFIAKFQIVVAFDAAPVPVTSTSEVAPPAEEQVPPAEEETAPEGE